MATGDGTRVDCARRLSRPGNGSMVVRAPRRHRLGGPILANYLIAVGGTGQHVALAVADFIALAHEIFPTPDEFPGVHLILVDADQAADTEQPSAWQEARGRLAELGLLSGDSFECVPLPVNSRMANTRRMYEF